MKQAKDIIEQIEIYKKNTVEEYFLNYGEMESLLQNVSEKMADIISKIALLSEDCPAWMKIHLLSFCMKTSGDKSYTIELLNAVIDADYEQVGEYNKLSHYWQTNMAIFVDSSLGGFEAEKLLIKLYRQLFTDFYRVLGGTRRKYIPLDARRMDVVFVFTSQVLGMQHAPTKTLLDRCYILQKYLNKKVYIINTAMQASQKGMAPFFGLKEGAYEEALLNDKNISYKDVEFDYYQCENNMPNPNTIVKLVQMIVDKKPGYMLNIGGSDICADICGMFVPEITISTVFSKISTSCGEYQIVDKALNNEDLVLLEELGVEKEKVKRSLFTFVFKEQKEHFTKAQLGFKVDSFVLLTVGWRLGDEISEEFLEVLEKCVSVNEKIAVAFMGQYDNYEEIITKYPGLQKNSKFLGQQEDALAVTECCDLYVNPKRNGGGSSIAEALFKGLPVVTLPEGDGAVAASDIFWVSDYTEMKEKIISYATDKAFYDEMSQRAKKRAEQLLDSKTSFCKVITEIEEEIKNQGL